ncbi:hypothetical protein LCGC14_2888590, partial [marine sediment metagenome]
VRVTFYYINNDNSESLFFSRNGTHVTNDIFQYISRISIGSGLYKCCDSDIITSTINNS